MASDNEKRTGTDRRVSDRRKEERVGLTSPDRRQSQRRKEGDRRAGD